MNLLLQIISTKKFNPINSGLALVKVVTKTNLNHSDFLDLYHLGDYLLIPMSLIKKVELDDAEYYLITHSKLFEYQNSLITKWPN